MDIFVCHRNVEEILKLSLLCCPSTNHQSNHSVRSAWSAFLEYGYGVSVLTYVGYVSENFNHLLFAENWLAWTNRQSSAQIRSWSVDEMFPVYLPRYLHLHRCRCGSAVWWPVPVRSSLHGQCYAPVWCGTGLVEHYLGREWQSCHQSVLLNFRVLFCRICRFGWIRQ